MAGPDAKKLKLGGLHVYVFQAKLFEVEGTFKVRPSEKSRGNNKLSIAFNIFIDANSCEGI